LPATVTLVSVAVACLPRSSLLKNRPPPEAMEATEALGPPMAWLPAIVESMSSFPVLPAKEAPPPCAVPGVALPPLALPPVRVLPDRVEVAMVTAASLA